MGDVRELLETVEACSAAEAEKRVPRWSALVRGFKKVFGDQDETAYRAYEGSLDAALALHKAVLPGWVRDVDATAPECGIDVRLSPATAPSPEVKGTHENEARAWLIAILRALSEDRQ